MPGVRVVVIGVAAIAVTMGACTSDTDGQTEPPVSAGGLEAGSGSGPVAASTSVSGSIVSDDGSGSDGKSENDLLFERVVGMPLDQVDQRVLAARSANAGECLAARGFQPTLASRDRAFTEVPPSYGGYAEYMIRRIDAERAAGVAPGRAPSVEEENAWMECDQTATESVPDPIAVFAAWVDTVSSEIAGRVESDPRTLEAVRRFDECLAGSGYDSSTPDPLIDPAFDIYARYDDGEISYEAAVGQLRALSESDSPQIKAASECSAAYDSVTGAVYSEYVNAYLDENAELLTELRQSIEDSLKQLDSVQPS